MVRTNHLALRVRGSGFGFRLPPSALLTRETSMTNRPFRILPAGMLLLLLTGLAAPGRAEEKPAPARRPSVFQQVIPRPTGQNGYEELVLAAEAFRASRYYMNAQEANTTLEFKREVLADRQVVRALSLLRQ